MTKVERRGVYLYIDGKQVKNDLKSIRTEFYKANADLNKMTVGSQEYNRQLKKVGTLKGMLDQHSSSIRQAGKDWSNTGKKANGVLSKLIGSAKGLLPAFGWAAIVAGAVKGAKALFNLYSETAKARREAEQLTGLSGKPLADFTAAVQATSDTFNKDFSEVLVSTNNFAKTMGISAEEALDKINDGFITGADSSGEFLDILKEYGPQFKAAGLSADESIALISQQIKSGIYSDKGIDAIKEATISLREMTPATKAAIDNIGISSNVLQKNLRNGSISIFDAIQMISNRMAELPPQSTEVGTAIADIFRGAGEDAGLEYITMLGQAELSLTKVKENAGENATVQERLLDANIQLKQAWGELMGTGTGSFTAIKATATELLAGGIVGLSNGIKGLRDWFIELYNGSLPVRAGFQYMLASWATGFNIVKTSMQGLWENIKLGGKLIKGVLTFDLDGIKTAFQEYRENTKKAVVANAQKVATTWKSAYENTLNGNIKVTEPTISTKIATKDKKQAKFNEANQNQYAKKRIDNLKKQIEKEFSEKEKALKEQRAKEEISQEQFQERMKLLELAHLEAQKAFKQENGEDTLDIESEIANKKIEIVNDRIKQEEELEKDAEQKQKERNEKLKKDFEEIKKLYDDKYSDPKDNTQSGQIKSIKKIGEDYEGQLNSQLAILKQEEDALVNSEYFKTLSVEEQESQRTAIMQREANIRKKFHDQSVKDAQEQAEIWMDIGGQVGTMFGQMLSDQEITLKEFGKNVLLLALDVVEKQLEIAIVSATIQSLATPGSVLTFGAKGLIQAAILTGLMKAAFAGLKGLIGSFSEGGYTGDGGTLEPAGMVHRGEYVIPKRLMANPIVASMAQSIEVLRTKPINANPILPRYADGGFVSNKSTADYAERPLKNDSDDKVQKLTESVSQLYEAVDILSKRKSYIAIEQVEKELGRWAKIQQTRGL